MAPPTGSVEASEADLCLQRRRNLMIFLAAWSCFLVKKVPLTSQAQQFSPKAKRTADPLPAPRESSYLILGLWLAPLLEACFRRSNSL